MTSSQVPRYRADARTASRGELARRRANELQHRRQELANGVSPSAKSVEIARHRAVESSQRAIAAHRASAARHLEAGEAHRIAAALHEQAAMRAGDRESEIHQAAAERHRAQAALHERASKVEQGAAADAESERS
jgi:hypothetical protein